MGLMERIIDPKPEEIARLLARPALEAESVASVVAEIIEDVRLHGDSALLAYAERFDHARLESLTIPRSAMEDAKGSLDEKLRTAIDRAKRNIERFHVAQRPRDEQVETEPGVYCWRKSIPLETVGIYVPGGSAPLFSTVLMLGIPAQLAGCKHVVLATPPRHDGTIHPAILYAASLSGVTKIVAAGGAQAIAALAYGTETVPAVDKIFGPGNRFVTEAKQQVSTRRCAIDLPAGPSEVMVVVDASSNPVFAAADLLSQAEHGPDSQTILVVSANDVPSGQKLVDAVERELEVQLEYLPRKELALLSLQHAKAVLVTDIELLPRVINTYGPEHLIVNTVDFVLVENQVRNAGSVFLGEWTCESAGDYASGTNHTLPTAGWARSYSGVSLDSFYKKITFQRITRQGLQSLGPVIETMATAESLDAHAHAVRVRLSSIKGEQK